MGQKAQGGSRGEHSRSLDPFRNLGHLTNTTPTTPARGRGEPLAGALRALQGRKRSSETTSCSPTSTDISLFCRAPPPDASSTSSAETCGRHPEWPRPALVQLGLSVVSTHRKKSRQTAWLMPRTRLGWDWLSHLRAGWSVASGRLNGAPSGRCRGQQWQELSGTQLPRAAAAIQLMPPCRLLLCRTARDEEVHGGEPAESAGDGMGLPVDGCHPSDGDRPERRRYSPVPGLPAVRPLSRPPQLQPERAVSPPPGRTQCGRCLGLSNCRARLVLADGGE
jgi:hypothetical protein